MTGLTTHSDKLSRTFFVGAARPTPLGFNPLHNGLTPMGMHHGMPEQ